MTEEEISRIKKHIEIHARQERGAVIITRVLRKAVDELEHIAELEKENAELKEELKKWKDEWQEQAQKATDEGFARSLQTNQLSKAKEIIKKFSEFANNKIEYDPVHPQEHTDLWNKLCAEAEQFISEVEK